MSSGDAAVTSPPASSSEKRGRLRSIWRYRELLRNLMVHSLTIKYQRSSLGFVWTLLQPLAIITVLTLVFTRVVRLPIDNYWAFLLSGYFVWNFVQQCLNAGTYTLNSHVAMIRSVPFPKEVVILAAVLARLIEFSIELLLVAVVIAAFHHQTVPASYLGLPLLVGIQLLLVLGIVLPVATLSVFYTDIPHALPAILVALFYICPVFYPVDMVPLGFRSAYLSNPVAQILDLYHTTLYEGAFPTIPALVVAAATAAVIMTIGYAIFLRFEGLFAEIV